MWKEVAILLALALVQISASPRQADKSTQKTEKPAAQTEKTASAATPPAFVIPTDIAKQANPAKPTAASIAAGKQMYGYDCAMCHGADGGGKGDLAGDMKLNLKDYRDPAALKDMTDGEMFYIIQKGKGDMTGEGDRQKPEQIWNMINYVRSLAKKTPSPAKAKPPS